MMPTQLVRLFVSSLPASELRELSSGMLPTLGSEIEDDSCFGTTELSDDVLLETADDDCRAETLFTRFFTLDDVFLEDGNGLLDGGVLVAGLLVGVSGAEVAAEFTSDEV